MKMFEFFLFKFIYIYLYLFLNSKQTNINSTSFIESSITTNIKVKESLSFLNITHIKNNSNFDNINNNEIISPSIFKYNKNNRNLKKNLLIGAFRIYNWDTIEPFFSSFKKAGFKNSDCIMFVDTVNQFTINKMKSLGVIVYEIPIKFRNENIINCRWKIYEDFLMDNADKYNLVFTTDLRDSFFQRDVFKCYENNNKPFLGVAIEDGILTNEINQQWILNSYGENIYQNIKNERIICVGTIWGTIDKFHEFSRIMYEQLNTGQNRVEQAVGNVLIYNDKLFHDCLVESINDNGYVMTIGLTNRDNINLDNENNILNGNGEIAAVIHQYDRKPDIVRNVRNKYCKQNLSKINHQNSLINYH